MRSRLVISGLALALASTLISSARADQVYHVSGKDSFTVGSSDLSSDIRYDGSESLSVQHAGRATRYTANVRYVRVAQGAKNAVHASFIAMFLPSGEQVDADDHDPDYLAVLNQPFAVQLDTATMNDLAHLHGSVPFTFPSPITGSTLQGYLRHAGDAMVGTTRTFGIAFDASGPMRGELPDRPTEMLRGTIAMHGTAYYDRHTALLSALDATMTITGRLVQRDGNSYPVSISYRRTIRADQSSPLKEAKGLKEANR